MATKWISAAKGIRYREHATRKHGKRFDRYYTLVYKLNGKTVSEGVGWNSDGVKQEDCERIMMALRDNQRAGTGPQTLAEMRQSNLEVAEAEKKEKAQAASLTLQGVFEGGYLAHQKAKGKKAEVIRHEQGFMQNYLEPFFGDISLYELNVDTMDKFLAFLRETKSQRTGKPLSHQTQKHAINLVNQIFSYATSRIDNTLQSPVRHITRPSTNTARERFLTTEEARLLLDALASRSKDTHDMALLSLFCGLRSGEILALTWGDVNFDENSVHLKDTKNKTSRHAYMTPESTAMLRGRYTGQALREFVFSSAELSKTFERTVKALGLNEGRTDRRDRVVFHTLRHTFASWHAKAGTPLYTISKLLGHKTLAMTQRYAHLCPDAERQAIMVLHGALDEKKD